jgi:hypothetical protein
MFSGPVHPRVFDNSYLSWRKAWAFRPIADYQLPDGRCYARES